MYEKGQRIAIRSDKTQTEEVVLVEDILITEEGQMLKVRSPGTHHTRVVNPQDNVIVEHLED